MKDLRAKIKLLLFVFCILNFFGCVSVPYVGPQAPPISPLVPGIYHKVEKGQTLWRISKIYNIDLDEIARINRISDATAIEQGQLVFIPKAKKEEAVVSRYTSEDFIWPVKGRVISSFGSTFSNIINRGINIEPYGNSDVVASRSGKVVFCSDNFVSFGKTIIIDHGDGFSSVYARNSEVFIRSGDTVQKGTVIAKVGNAGRDSNVYLHFEIRKGYLPQNPHYFLP